MKYPQNCRHIYVHCCNCGKRSISTDSCDLLVVNGELVRPTE